jgi:processive 1,2-diacylglycerol beta-glucosyltransferase
VRVLVLSANVGEGHDAAASSLAADLRRDRSVEVSVENGLELVCWPLQHLLRDGYRAQLRRAPWSYGLVYFVFTRVPPARWIGRWGLCLLARRRLSRFLSAEAPDIIVSTFPGMTPVLGHLRRRGRLCTPVAATITDVFVHGFWADKGVDLHLVMYEQSLRRVEAIAGRGSARRVRPLVRPTSRL